MKSPLYVVSITAHRKLIETDIRTIHAVMKSVVDLPHVEAIYFGGARGGDSEALRAALHHRGSGNRPRLVVVVPDTLNRQPTETQIWSKQADEIIELKNPITKDDGFAAYAIRDQYLVDAATSLVAFFSGNYSSGTGKTVRMAEKAGIRVTKVPVGGVSTLQ